MAREELEKFDCVIIGGGIVGAGIFREQSLHGMKSLLLDQADFNSQTSQGSSKMLHGGIRYLENFDFGLVFEALKEKNLWLRLTPHISKEVPFYLPIYKHSKWPLFFMRIGLFLYDVLSLFKNSPHKILSKKKVLQQLPGLNPSGLTGAGMYYDGIVDDSKLGLECIYDALKSPACLAMNYKKVIQINGTDGDFTVVYEDMMTKEQSSVYAKKIIFATGPFTDKALKDLAIPWEPVLLPSKGTHLWLEKNALPIKDAMVLQTNDGRIIFVIPQRESILVGTTEVKLKQGEEILNIKPSQEEIDYLLETLLEYFPKNPVEEDQILGKFAAVRPLVKAGVSSSKTSRHHKTYLPQKGIHVIVGGKYTTFRKMAEDINKKVLKELGIKHNPKLTLRPLKASSVVKDPFIKKITQEDLDEIMKNEFVRTKEDLISRRLSLHSLRQIDNEELKEALEKIKLESFRNPH